MSDNAENQGPFEDERFNAKSKCYTDRLYWDFHHTSLFTYLWLVIGRNEDE